MTELRKHREISEIVFGLGLKGIVDWNDIDTSMLLYPYNAAAQDRRDNPEEANLAWLMLRYGADAIKSAEMAAEQVDNGVPPKEWVQQLMSIYQNYKVVNVMHRAQRQIEKDQDPNLEEVRNVINDSLTNRSVEPLSWADIKEEFDQEWLWSGWIPQNEVTILVGQQGAGKSALALYIADCFANGQPLPDGSVIPENKSVLWVETEGRFGENVRRAQAWHVDTRRIYIPSQDRRKAIDLTQPDHKILIRTHANNPDIGLVVVDSLGGSLVDENDASAKRVLLELSKMAQETRTTFLIIHHLRKPQKSKGYQQISLAEVRGHSGITQFAPSVIAIDYDGNEGVRMLCSLKMNMAEEPAAMAFTMGPLGLVWSETTADHVRRQVIQETVHWLERILANGPMTIKDVRDAAEEGGYNWNMIKQAITFPNIRVMKNSGGERSLSI